MSYDALCEAFAALAAHGAQVGPKIAFEDTPFSHHIRTTEQALAFVTDVAHPTAA